jgi:cellulose synthase operon protein YhjQ
MTDRRPPYDQNETPEDVATLYSWANLHGAKYRDFSASRAQTREQVRLRVQQALEAEQAAASQALPGQSQPGQAQPNPLDPHPFQAEPAQPQPIPPPAFTPQTFQVEQSHAAQSGFQPSLADLSRIDHRTEADRAAEVQRLAETARAAEESRQAELIAQYTARKAAEQAAQHEQARLAAAQAVHPEQARQAAEQAAQLDWARLAAEQAAQREQTRQAAEQAQRQAAELAARQASERAVREAAQQAEAARQALAAQWAAQRAQAAQPPPAAWQPAEGFQTPLPGGAPAPPSQYDYPAYAHAQRPRPAASEPPLREDIYEPRDAGRVPPWDPAWTQPSAQYPPQAPRQASPQYSPQAEAQEPVERPAWLTPDRPDFPTQPAVPHAPEDTLQGSRDRLTSRWYALRGVFETQGAPQEAPAPAPGRAPVVALFSLAGGVGKTSMVATVGRALSSRGERVLLVDTAAYGLLPFFFGAHDQRPGQLRTFSPPGTSTDAPIQMVTVDPEGLGPEGGNHEALCVEIGKHSRGVSRVIVDLATASGATTRRVLKMAPLVVVPMVPDMNSVVSVSSIDSFFQHNPNPSMKSAMPFYVLNQFDPALPLHLDIREVLREQLGDRLLPFVVRRSPAVSEALAEGMTVMDYAPSSTVAEDFGTLAGWVKMQSAPASSSYRGVRWSER